MDNLQEIRTCATSLGLIHTKNELETLIHTAETEESSYVTFLQNVLGSEICIFRSASHTCTDF